MSKKIPSLLLVLLVYIITISSALCFYYFVPLSNILLKFFLMYLISCIIVYIFSMIFNNAGMTRFLNGIMIILITVLYSVTVTELNLQTYLVITLLCCYGLRSIINNIIKFKSLKEDDWRYQMFKSRKPWFLINLFAVNIMPFLIIFTCLLPAIKYIELSTVINWNISSIIAFILTFIGLLLITVADSQLHLFKKKCKNPLDVCALGLYGRSRHPNYFGEMLFWWGIFLLLLSINEKSFILLLGPLLLTILLVVVCIPLMEKKEIKEKRDYADYVTATHMLLPFRKKYVTENPQVNKKNKK